MLCLSDPVGYIQATFAKHHPLSIKSFNSLIAISPHGQGALNQCVEQTGVNPPLLVNVTSGLSPPEVNFFSTQ